MTKLHSFKISIAGQDRLDNLTHPKYLYAKNKTEAVDRALKCADFFVSLDSSVRYEIYGLLKEVLLSDIQDDSEYLRATKQIVEALNI